MRTSHYQAGQTKLVLRCIPDSHCRMVQSQNPCGISCSVYAQGWHSSHQLCPKSGHVDVDGDDDSESVAFLAPNSLEDFWKAIQMSGCLAEKDLPISSLGPGGPPFQCNQQACFGVSQNMAWMNYPFSSSDFAFLLVTGGYSIDFQGAVVSEADLPNLLCPFNLEVL